MQTKFTTETFSPPHQPRAGSPVSFTLRPLDMPTFWAVQASLKRGSNLVGWDGAAAAFEHSVVGWSGLPQEFSPAAKRDALETFDRDMAIWLGQIAGHLYLAAILTEDERKNS